MDYKYKNEANSKQQTGGAQLTDGKTEQKWFAALSYVLFVIKKVYDSTVDKNYRSPCLDCHGL